MKRLVPALLAIFILAAPARAENLPEKAERLASYLEKCDSWAMKALILLALADVPHPAAVAPFEKALADRDGRLLAYAVEALASMREDVLRSGAGAKLVDRLVDKELKRPIEGHHRRVLGILGRVAGRELADRKAAESWWREADDDYRAADWAGGDEAAAPPPAEEGAEGEVPTEDGARVQEETQVTKLIQKLFDLGDAGLEICFVIDATGSMQPTIDAVRDSIDNLASVLGSIVPRFRIAVVVYRDLDDMKDGARLMSPLTANYQSVKEDLAKETASGGGDFEERVEKGLELAIGKDNKVGWTAKPGKVVVVIGDAPPHEPDVAKAVDLAREAHRNPFGVKNGMVTTGGKRTRLPPFIVSTIVVGGAMNTQLAFEKIAEAGGGSCVALEQSSDVLKRILILSFGPEWEAQIGRFVDLYLKYRGEGIVR